LVRVDAPEVVSIKTGRACCLIPSRLVGVIEAEQTEENGTHSKRDGGIHQRLTYMRNPHFKALGHLLTRRVESKSVGGCRNSAAICQKDLQLSRLQLIRAQFL
jgi:hypothetical protein